MIITNCAACTAPLAHDAPRCIRCKTRYCDATCQHDHWRRGHKQICKRIHRGGNAEQYYADKKYKEAVAEAVEACAEDTKGQTCYICLEAVHARTGEGLVRGCGCGDRDGVASGRTGVAHVSCLVEQAKILVAEIERTNLDGTAKNDRFQRWHMCELCEQRYHGLVRCALGWACWKTYLGRPDTDRVRQPAMSVLGSGLSDVRHDEDALSVQDAELSMLRRVGASQESVLITQSNLAITCERIGRSEEAMHLRRDVYSGRLKLWGEEHLKTLEAANNYASSLIFQERFEEARSLTRKTTPVARRVLGESHDLTLRIWSLYALALCRDANATLNDLREAVTTLEETISIARRVLGGAHPIAVQIEHHLRYARAVSAAT